MDLVNKVVNQESAYQTLKWCISMGTSHIKVTQRLLEEHFRSSYKIADSEDECVEMLRDLVSGNNYVILREILKYVDSQILQTVTTGSRKNLLTKLLISSVESGYNDVCKVLAKAGADLNVQYHGKPLFTHALVLGHIKVAKALVEEGADIHALDNRGDTAIVHVMTSSIKNEIKVASIKWLTESGIDPSKPTTRGKSLIHIAAGQSGNVINYLIDLNCDVNIQDTLNGDSPLHVACTMLCEESILQLVKHGAKMNLENFHGETPLYKLLKLAHNCGSFQAKTRVSFGRNLVAFGFRMPQHKLIVGRDKKKSTSRDKVYDVYNRVTRNANEVLRLKTLCRVQIVHSFLGGNFKNNVQSLHFPEQLKNFLLYKDEIV